MRNLSASDLNEISSRPEVSQGPNASTERRLLTRKFCGNLRGIRTKAGNHNDDITSAVHFEFMGHDSGRLQVPRLHAFVSTNNRIPAKHSSIVFHDFFLSLPSQESGQRGRAQRIRCGIRDGGLPCPRTLSPRRIVSVHLRVEHYT